MSPPGPPPSTVPTATAPALGLGRLVLPFALGYFLSYLYRTVNAVVSPELAADPALTAAGLDAGAMGLLTGTYFLAFAAAQLPLGLLLDRFGPRRVEAALLLVAGAGAAAFGLAEGLGGLILGRALIGLGVSACLMGALKGFRQWAAPERLPLLQGLIMAAGGLGVLTSTVPVRAAMTLTDWRGVFLGLGALTVLVAGVIFLFVRDLPPRPAGRGETLGEQARGTWSVFTSGLFWVIAPSAALQQAGYMSLQGLWAGAWLRDVGGMDAGGAAEVLSLMAVAMVGGHLLSGTLAEKLARRGIATPERLFFLGNIGFNLLLVALAALAPQGWAAAALWPVLILVGTTGVLSFAVVAQHFPPHMAGRATTTINLVMFLTAFAVQWGMGAIINLWPKTAAGTYPAAAYAAAFLGMAGLCGLALAWQVWARRQVAAREARL